MFFAGELGLEPRTADSKSAELPITPFPTGLLVTYFDEYRDNPTSVWRGVSVSRASRMLPVRIQRAALTTLEDYFALWLIWRRTKIRFSKASHVGGFYCFSLCAEH